MTLPVGDPRGVAMALVAGGMLLAACARATPPAAPLPTAAARAGTPVRAPVARTWAAVLSFVDSVGARIEQLDTAAHVVTTRAEALSNPALARWVDCGRERGAPRLPQRGSASIAVWPDLGGDPARSVVRMEAYFTSPARPALRCTSTGVLEAEQEAAIRARAERAPSGRAPAAPP